MRNRRLCHILVIPALLVLTLIIAGCSGLRPSRPVPQETQAAPYVPPIRVYTTTPAVTPQASEATQVADCVNGLTYLQDLSVPDGTHFDPGTKIEKKWQVKNTGTCNWMDGYTLKLVGGEPLGAAETQDLVPARNGTEAVIEIDFTAPSTPGDYDSSWQAFDPEGQPFGDKVFIQITVITP